MALDLLATRRGGGLRMGAASRNWLADRASTPAPCCVSLSECSGRNVNSYALLFMAVSFLGPRDALGSPAFLLYFFFILLSILQLDARLCLFIGFVAALENFIFAQVGIDTLAPEHEAEIW